VADSLDCEPDAIAALVRAGDVAALDRMTRCFGDRLLAIGRRACGCDDRAKDAVQDALLAAGLHLTDFRADGEVEGWMAKMVVHACARMRRGGKNAPHAALDDAAPSAEASPEVAAAGREVLHRLGELLGELGPIDRAIVVLADAEDWTAPEIAVRLGLSPDSVRARLSRAHKRLRALLVTVEADDGS